MQQCNTENTPIHTQHQGLGLADGLLKMQQVCGLLSPLLLFHHMPMGRYLLKKIKSMQTTLPFSGISDEEIQSLCNNPYIGFLFG